MSKFTVMTAETSGVVVLKADSDQIIGRMPEFALAATTMQEVCDYLMDQVDETPKIKPTTPFAKTAAPAKPTLPAVYQNTGSVFDVDMLARHIVEVCATPKSNRFGRQAAVRLYRNLTGATLLQSRAAIDNARRAYVDSANRGYRAT